MEVEVGQNQTENIDEYEDSSLKLNSEKIKVSVVIPVYNVEKYIRECLDSLVNQTLKDIEFICIDDGSFDNSVRIIEEYAKNDSRFVVLKQENQGPGQARNRGIENARGEFIAFVDPDDKLELGALEALYLLAKKQNVQVVQFNFTEFGEFTKDKLNSFYKKYKKAYNYDIKKNKMFSWKDISCENLLVNIDFRVWNRFYSTKFIRDYGLSFAPTKCGEDQLFVIKMLFNASKIYFLNKSLYWYRLRPGSIVNSKSKLNFAVFTNLKMVESFFEEKGFLPELKSILCQYKIYRLIWHYNQFSRKDIPEFLEKTKEYLSENEYEMFKKTLKQSKYSIGEKIFSLKNKRIAGVKYKYLTLLGVKVVFSPKKTKKEKICKQ